ncbi:MAG: hypothetical protein FWG63_00300 [Defluviitaleaceae bacterium]|nr:hypothetical protein [Defluviitaleaceae bacterium]
MEINISNIKKILKALLLLGYFAFFCKVLLLIYMNRNPLNYGFFLNVMAVLGIFHVLYYQYVFWGGLEKISNEQYLPSIKDKFLFFGKLILFVAFFVFSYICIYVWAFSDLLAPALALGPYGFIMLADSSFEGLLKSRSNLILEAK